MKRPYKDNLKHWQQSVQSGLCLTFWIAIFFPGVAHAYVDPGSGSVIVTTILGLIAAIGYTFRKYFYKIKRMITGKITEEEQQDSE